MQPTGCENKLLYQTVSAQFKKIIYISPLLSLVSDQVNKLMMKTLSDDTTIVPVNLDQVQKNKEMNWIRSLVNNNDNSTCVIIFTSLHSITTKYPNFLHTIKTLIMLVFVDVFHLYNSFGRSLRDKLSLLQSKIFSELRGDFPMLFLTSTCTKRIQASFKKMIGMPITHYYLPPAAQL